MQKLRDAFDGRRDVRHVGIFRLPQRRRHADVDRVEPGHGAEIGGRAQASRRHELGDFRRLDVGNVGRAAIDRIDLARVEVDAGGVEAGARELDGERQADIAEADDADAGAM